MDAVKFLQERARMCNSFSPDCEGFRVDEEKPVMSECYLWMFENPERAVKIVEAWAKEHPRKTRQSVFLEQWPNATRDSGGVVNICPKLLDADISCTDDETERTGLCKACDDCCREFWTQEVE